MGVLLKFCPPSLGSLLGVDSLAHLVCPECKLTGQSYVHPENTKQSTPRQRGLEAEDLRRWGWRQCSGLWAGSDSISLLWCYRLLPSVRFPSKLSLLLSHRLYLFLPRSRKTVVKSLPSCSSHLLHPVPRWEGPWLEKGWCVSSLRSGRLDS